MVWEKQHRGVILERDRPSMALGTATNQNRQSFCYRKAKNWLGQNFLSSFSFSIKFSSSDHHEKAFTVPSGVVALAGTEFEALMRSPKYLHAVCSLLKINR